MKEVGEAHVRDCFAGEASHALQPIRASNVHAPDAQRAAGPPTCSPPTCSLPSCTPESSDDPFRTLLESLQEGALTLGRDGTVLYANTFLGSLLGEPLSEIVGRPLTSLVAPSYQSLCRPLLEQALVAPIKQTLRLETRHGTIPVQLTLSPLSAGEGATCCAVVFDLREREQAERARVEREAAEAANCAKDRFVAVLGHEMRSPLNTVLGWAQILANREDVDASVRKAAKTIERNANAQAQLISELLDVSRIVAGKLHLEFQIVDLRAVVASTVAAAQRSLEKAVQVSDVSLVQEAPVLGDGTRLQQIMTSLIGNAIKFTEPGGRIEVELSYAEGHVQVVVRDDGTGIPSDQIDTSFELFQQGPASRRKGGLGLGLSITKQLVEGHGGQILVTSAGAGQGATFTVRLPRVSGVLPAAEQPPVLEAQLAGCSILVIDDDVDILDLLRYALEQRGARVDTAQSAAAALEKLAAGRYDVLLSDLGLPDRDGLALLREVRARGLLESSLRAVALTGYGSEANARQCAAAGFELHLIKPISPAEVARSITQLLERPAP